MTREIPEKRLQDQRLQAAADAIVAGGVPGAILALRRGDDTAYGAAGTSNPHGGAAMHLGLSFDMASVTKVLGTTASLLRLVSDGALSLDDPVSRFVPTFSEGAKNAVTVRQLLEHRGGLTEWWPLYIAAAGRTRADRTRAEAALDALPLAYEPGAGRHYSDLGFMLLGRVIEAVTAASLPDAVHRLVLHPLGLTQTRYAHPATAHVVASARGDEVERRMVQTGVPYPVPFAAADFEGWRDEIVAGDVNDGNAFHAFGGVSGHAGLFSTVPDLLSFGVALGRAGEFGELWRPEVVDEFFAPSADENQALGFRRYRMALVAGGEPIDVLGHPGFTGVAFGFVPGGDTAFAIATNRLLSEGEPVSNAQLWHDAEPVWRHVLAETETETEAETATDTDTAAPNTPLADAREES
jgi:CubicO group peptidase (beta-lactamase class C family)